MTYKINPIGYVRDQDDCNVIEILPQYEEAIHGLEEYSHLILLVWFHKSDNEKDRSLLKVHPRHNKDNPLTGIFATRAPVRPNPVALFIPSIISIDKNIIRVSKTEAFDGTPVIDIKPYLPHIDSITDASAPDFR